jgi:uncharacterized membrane protein
MAAMLFVFLLAIVCWLGGMIFFSAFVAPVLFGRLSISDAGKVVGTIFPRYYWLGYVAGTLALILALYFALSRRAQGAWAVTALFLAIALALTVYAGTIVEPQAHAIRGVAEEQNPEPARQAEFDRLHRLSVVLNGAVMALDLLALAGSAVALTHNGS